MDCCSYRQFVWETLLGVYREQDSLIPHRNPPRPGPQSPRATERSIVGRFLVHGHARIDKHFPERSALDFEYERFGPLHWAKTINGCKISPDLIAHRRGDPQGNYLVVEIKRSGHRRRRTVGLGPAEEDYRKVHVLTHCLEHYPNEPFAGDPLSSYRLGVCVELDTEGADLWWVKRSKAHACPAGCQGWQAGQPARAHRERWAPGAPLPRCPLPH